MQLITSTILIFLFLTVKCDDSCDNDKSHLAPVRLTKDLLCGYDKSSRPVLNHQNSTKVLIQMIVKFFSLSEFENSFSVDCWLAVFWNDQHLRWNPKDYDSLSTLHLDTSKIWVPDLAIYNRDDLSTTQNFFESNSCHVSSTGRVACVPPTHQSSLCVPDLTYFPFDTQNCTIRIGSWVHSGEEIDLRAVKPPLTTEDLVPNGIWKLDSTKVIRHPGRYKCCPNNTFPSINFSFKVKRLVGAHTATLILPAISLIVLTLTSIWLDPRSSSRLNLCCVNFIAHFLYIQYVAWIMPQHGNNVPLIAVFARDSLILSVFTIIFSVVFKNLVEKVNPAPIFIVTSVSILSRFNLKRVLFSNVPAEAQLFNSEKANEDDEAPSKSKSNDWSAFVEILDWICFISYIIVYFTMFIAFTP